MLVLPAWLLLCIGTSGFAVCLEGDCKDGKGHYISADGREYVGEFKHGFLWGQGKLVLPMVRCMKAVFLKDVLTVKEH